MGDWPHSPRHRLRLVYLFRVFYVYFHSIRCRGHHHTPMAVEPQFCRACSGFCASAAGWVHRIAPKVWVRDPQ